MADDANSRHRAREALAEAIMVRRTQRTLLFETLESRTLFAGVTILTHGLAGEVDGWVDSLSKAIVARAGGSANASVYTLVVDDNSGGLRVSSFTRDAGFQDYQTTGGGEVIIKLD